MISNSVRSGDRGVSDQDLATGFAAVMAGIEQASPEEIASLELAADRAEFGLDVYALGMEHLTRGAHDQALGWLERAAQYGVTSAARVLEELRRARAIDDLFDQAPVLGQIPRLDRTDIAVKASEQGADMLESAAEQAAHLLEEAQAIAERQVAEARNWADRMRTAAAKKAEAVIREANREAEQKNGVLKSEVARIKAVAENSLKTLRDQREGLDKVIAHTREKVDTLERRVDGVTETGHPHSRDTVAVMGVTGEDSASPAA
ncbi:hypothetical protein [Streptomyces acidicola]|uniref:hypothetical protein n=1 Tax=Streptomyces acidicola TaxID=2596892 RepID=UPI003822C3DB